MVAHAAALQNVPATAPMIRVAANEIRNTINTQAKPLFGIDCKYMRIVRVSNS